MKIYYISILEQYYRNSDIIFNKELVTSTENTGRFYTKKKEAINIAKNLFDELSNKDIYQQDIEKSIQNEEDGQFYLKTVEGNCISVFIQKLVG